MRTGRGSGARPLEQSRRAWYYRSEGKRSMTEYFDDPFAALKKQYGARPAKEARDPSTIINQLRGTVAGNFEVITSADAMATLRGITRISTYQQLTLLMEDHGWRPARLGAAQTRGYRRPVRSD